MKQHSSSAPAYLPEVVKDGSVAVRSEPSGAKWYLDGAYVGTTPGEMTRVQKGSHRVTVKLHGHEHWERQIQVRAGGREEVLSELIPINQEPRAGKEWTDPKTGMAFVWVPGGCFQMGSPPGEAGRDSDEGPVHEVCVDGFWMGKTEVTNAQYRMFKQGHNSRDYEGHSLDAENQPVVYVSWEDAKAYAEWLSGNSPHTFRLPTEAEWEYACRAGTRTARFWGDDPDDACQYANVNDRTSKRVNKFDWEHHECDDGYAVTSPVGAFQPNAFGLYDMLGNVWEWCEDVYDKNAYSKHSRKNPVVTSGGSFRVSRGGGWGDLPGLVRCADRSWSVPGLRYYVLGFRLVREP